jgi:hypothetical protein
VRDARDLYLVAMALFVVTIAIGILNGADVVEFDRDQILTHVHAGTIGWLTLAIVASTFLLLGSSERRLVIVLAILVPVYVAAFYSGSLPLRAATGSALLVAIAWLLVWLWRAFLAGERTLPRLSVILGLTSFGYGAVIGVLIQLQGALAITIVPGDSIAAHASAMTFGYLVLVAMGLIEWRLLGTRGLPRAGLVQVVALFAGGLIISIGLMAGAEQAAGGLYLLTELVAVVLFVARIWPSALRVGWLVPTATRHVGAASLWVVAALLLFMYLVATFLAAPDDPDAFPLNVLIASDHAAYIGVITNIIIALSLVLVSDRGGGGWIGQLSFWAVNIGLAVFVAGLIVDTPELKRLGAPIMGIALLATLAVLAVRLVSTSVDEAASDLAASEVTSP